MGRAWSDEYYEDLDKWYEMQEAIEDRLTEEPTATWMRCPFCGFRLDIIRHRDGEKEVKCTCGGEFKGYLYA